MCLDNEMAAQINTFVTFHIGGIETKLSSLYSYHLKDSFKFPILEMSLNRGKIYF